MDDVKIMGWPDLLGVITKHYGHHAVSKKAAIAKAFLKDTGKPVRFVRRRWPLPLALMEASLQWLRESVNAFDAFVKSVPQTGSNACVNSAKEVLENLARMGTQDAVFTRCIHEIFSSCPSDQKCPEPFRFLLENVPGEQRRRATQLRDEFILWYFAPFDVNDDNPLEEVNSN